MGILKDIQEIGAVTRSPATLERRLLKATEELGELAEAVLSATSASNAKRKNWMDIVDEACDVAIMGIDIAMTKPPGQESIDDEAWRDVVKKIFSLKLKKWQTQVKSGRTLIPKGPIEMHAEMHAERDPETLKYVNYVNYAESDGVGGAVDIRGGGDEPFPEPTEGCGKTIGHGQKCGYGILCLDCQHDSEVDAGLHK
jgi:NTP pyrophosphatase (non-canonical NTP hydrolase)